MRNFRYVCTIVKSRYMHSIETITSSVNKEFNQFKKVYNEILHSKCDLLNNSIDVVLSSQGKRIRPLLSLLVAKLCGKITDVTINSAVFLELMHTATLLHDDVVDDTLLRRGKPSLNALYQNKVAVLVGDYFLSTSLIMAMQTANLQLISIVSSTGRELSEGELFQLESTKEVAFSEERYKDIIYRKTASLFSACCQIGAISAEASKSTVELFKQFGMLLGMAFQIKDDIFDYFLEEEIGKPTGNDIREGKVTLPLLFALNKVGEEESKPYIEIIRSKDFSSEKIAKLLAFAKKQGGIEYAENKMMEYIEKAKNCLVDIPDSEEKSALIDLTDFIVQRTC